MNQIGFETFMAALCVSLEALSQENPAQIAACKSGEEFERCVCAVVQELLSVEGLTAELFYRPGGHSFPDIVLQFDDESRYGIEVKSSSATKKKGWKINGNSIRSGTKEEVLGTYILFGKTAMGQQAFRWKRYEDCVAGVAVTHSPRYMIDMDLAAGETFFDRSGLSYRELSEAERPIEKITAYFRGQGQRAWWLAESTPAALRMFAELSQEEQSELLGYCFAHFPEVFSGSTKKFSRCAIWMVSERSIVSSSLRDSFTAGGKVTVQVGGESFQQVPHIFKNLRRCRQEVLAALDNATTEELQEAWGMLGALSDSLTEKAAAWCAVCGRQVSADSVKGYEPEALLRRILEVE